jgi:hypothetical protein
MKPTSLTARGRFPFTDYDYHSGTISGYRSRCAKSVEPSFRNISRQYFQNEARCDFVGEAILFAMLTITSAMAVASGAQAAVQLCRVFGVL